jgi:hypothetical protein
MKNNTLSRKMPFQNLEGKSRLNLALFAVIIYFLLQFSLALYANNLFNTIGSDYLSFWSVGHIANTEGYGYVYDLPLLSKVQKPFHEEFPTDRVYAPIPAPLFAVFILPLRLIALLNPAIGFGLWTILNLAGLIVYLRFFIKDLAPGFAYTRPMIFLLISLPVFQTLFWGQINVWLVICLGEFMRLSTHKKDIRSGLWLAGLLIKPQTLVLLAPALLFQRSLKRLTSFTIAAIGMVSASFALSGLQGLQNLIGLWLNYASGIPTNAPENMVNWRMVALQLSEFLNPGIGWGVAMAGLLVTVVASFFLWRKPSGSSIDFPIALLGTLAATTAVTWHSHLHMMAIILPPLVYLTIRNQIPSRLVYIWIFLPPLVSFLVFILSAFGKLGYLPDFGYEGLFMGVTGLVLHLILLAWSVSTTRGIT